MEPGDGPALIFDIGGGSTELMQIEADGHKVVIHDWVSVPWGVVSLTEHAVPASDSLSARQASYAQMREVTRAAFADRSEEHTSELQSLMRTSYAVFCLTKKRRHIPDQF